jgi:hypothetical protein
MPLLIYSSRREIQAMCGADLSDMDEEKSKGEEGDTGKKTEPDSGKKKP